uniref:Candidate secreted effector n=1 Tax=Meloidogyne incognita TaxID=6306 RepID=A0A914NIV1_MELIC
MIHLNGKINTFTKNTQTIKKLQYYISLIVVLLQVLVLYPNYDLHRQLLLHDLLRFCFVEHFQNQQIHRPDLEDNCI